MRPIEEEGIAGGRSAILRRVRIIEETKGPRANINKQTKGTTKSDVSELEDDCESDDVVSEESEDEEESEVRESSETEFNAAEDSNLGHFAKKAARDFAKNSKRLSAGSN